MVWLNLAMVNKAVKNGLKAKMIKLPQFIILQNFKKNSQSWFKITRMCHFWTQNGPFVLNKIFLSTNHCYHFHLPIGLFYCTKFLKILAMRMSNFWVQNSPFPQMRIFSENLLMSFVFFIHAYLHAKNQSQILIY